MDSGMEIREMSVVRQFIRKTNRTRMTKRPPSSRDFFTLPMEPSMKRDWRKISELIRTSEGRAAPMSASSRSSLAVRSSEEVFGCLVTVMMTAGLPSLDATPSTGVLGPMVTSAMASSVTGSPFAPVFTTAFFISSMSLVERTPRTMYSLPYSYKVPPGAFWFIPLTASMTSSMDTP